MAVASAGRDSSGFFSRTVSAAESCGNFLIALRNCESGLPVSSMTRLQHDSDDPERRGQPVAGRAEIRADDVAGGFASERRARRSHTFGDIPVAHSRADDPPARRLDSGVQAHVALDRDDKGVARQGAFGKGVGRQDREHLIAVEDAAPLVAEDAAVAVAVVGDPDTGMGRENQTRESFRMLAPDPVVDVSPVGPVPEGGDLRCKGNEHGRAGGACRPVCRVERHLPSPQRSGRQDARGRIDVGLEDVLARKLLVDRECRIGTGGIEEGLDLCLVLIRQLRPIGAEELDPIVGGRIVGCRDHRAERGAA
jgi:hypothetical protein